MSDPSILLIEDEERIRDNLRILLSRSGYLVVAAAAGDEGLSRARASNFDVIVADMVMEGFEHFALLDALTTTVENTPIVVITGNTLMLPSDEAKRRGARAYLAKPFPIDSLRGAIEDCLGHQGSA